MAEPAGDVWPEADYLRYLAADRELYAWCLTRIGGVPPEEAAARAEARYPYEPPDKPNRGLIHHATAWVIATTDLFGSFPYRHPDEFGVAEELEAQSLWLFHERHKRAEPGAAADGPRL